MCAAIVRGNSTFLLRGLAVSSVHATPDELEHHAFGEESSGACVCPDSEQRPANGAVLLDRLVAFILFPRLEHYLMTRRRWGYYGRRQTDESRDHERAAPSWSEDLRLHRRRFSVDTAPGALVLVCAVYLCARLADANFHRQSTPLRRLRVYCASNSHVSAHVRILRDSGNIFS